MVHPDAKPEAKGRNMQPWLFWSILEASARTSSRVLQKWVGVSASTFGQLFIVTAIIGLVQCIAGFIALNIRSQPVISDTQSILRSLIFGVIATALTVLGFIIFKLEGEVGTTTFIVTLSIIPATLIDRFLFSERIGSKGWCGIALGIFAGYVMLELPSLSAFTEFPIWIWLAFLMMLLVAVNQGITKSMQKTDPLVLNFWGGLTTILLSMITLVVFSKPSAVFAEIIPLQWSLGIIIGLIVFGMWSFNLLAYRGKTNITLKKMVVEGIYLSATMVAGVWFFNEVFTVYKLAGILLFLGAVLLIRTTTKK